MGNSLQFVHWKTHIVGLFVHKVTPQCPILLRDFFGIGGLVNGAHVLWGFFRTNVQTADGALFNENTTAVNTKSIIFFWTWKLNRDNILRFMTQLLLVWIIRNSHFLSTEVDLKQILAPRICFIGAVTMISVTTSSPPFDSLLIGKCVNSVKLTTLSLLNPTSDCYCSTITWTTHSFQFILAYRTQWNFSVDLLSVSHLSAVLPPCRPLQEPQC